MNLESEDRVDSMILSSFHTGPDRNRFMYITMFARGNRGLSGESMTASLIASTAENSDIG